MEAVIDPAYRPMLEQQIYAAGQDYDRAILTVSSGALALTAALLHDIAPGPLDAGSRLLLIVSWGALTAALVLIIVSIQFGYRALRNALDNVDSTDIEALKTIPGGRAATWTGRLNIAAGGALVAGLVAFALFALVNLP
jgi:hypothetical protein